MRNFEKYKIFESVLKLIEININNSSSEPIIEPNNQPTVTPNQNIQIEPSVINPSPIVEPVTSTVNPPAPMIEPITPIEPIPNYTPDYSFENINQPKPAEKVDSLIEEIETPNQTSKEMMDKLWSDLKDLTSDAPNITPIFNDTDLTQYKNYNDYIFGFGKKHYGKEALTAEEIDALSSINGFLSESDFEKNKNSQFKTIINENNNLKDTVTNLTNETNSLNEKLNSQAQTINELNSQIANLKQIEEKFNTLSNIFKQNI